MRFQPDFETLEKAKHNRNAFSSGKPELDDFIKTKAYKHQTQGISRTFVLPSIDPAANNKHDIVAFFTLAPSEVKRDTFPAKLAKKLPNYPIPVILIAQLAVDESMHGQKLGGVTLIQCIKHICKIAIELAGVAIVVDCLDDEARSFYEHYGFEFLCQHNGKDRLFLPIATAQQMLG